MPDVATPTAPAAAAAPSPAPTPAPSPTPAAAPAQAASAAPATPSTPSGPQPPAALNSGDYANASDYYMAEVAYNRELAEFKQANPDYKFEEPNAAEPSPDAPKVDDKPAEQPAEQKTEEQEPEAATEDDPFSLEEPQALTPQALNDIINSDQALKTALDANPAAKNQLFKMAREHAELSQFKGIFPTAESAKFAQQTAGRTIQLRTKFQMADTPEGMASAFDDFMQEFAVMGPDGKQVVDERGQPVYGDDLYLLGEHIVDRYANNTLADVEARLQANQYKSDAERERDNDLRLALKILQDDLHPSEDAGAPDLSSIADEKVRADLQKRYDEVKQREDALKAQNGQQSKQQREAARKEGNQKFMAETVKRTFDQVGQTIEALRKAGAVIPDWMLKTTIPGTNQPAFYAEVGKEIDKLIKGDSYTYNQFLQLELLPPTPENIQQRVAAYDGLLQRDGNLRKIVTRIVRAYGKEMQARANTPAPPTTAQPEVRGGSAPQPKIMTADDAYRMAEQQLAKEVKGWNNMSPAERMSYTMTRQSQLMSQSRR